MAKKADKKATKGKRGGKGRALGYLFIVILMAVVLKYATLLILLGMLPGIVARYVDTSNDFNHSRVIMACNLAGVIPFVAEVIQKGLTSDNVHAMLFTPHVWMVMYGAAAFGWVLVWFFPQAVYFVMEIAQRQSVNGLNGKQQQIIDEWGLEVEKASRRVMRNVAFKEKNASDEG